MKTNIDLNKTAVISHFLANYEKFEWERKDGELTTYINNYKYRLASNYEGRYFQAIRIGETLGATIDSNGFPLVEELWNKVWDFVSKRNADIKWKHILNDLLNDSEQSDTVKMID